MISTRSTTLTLAAAALMFLLGAQSAAAQSSNSGIDKLCRSDLAQQARADVKESVNDTLSIALQPGTVAKDWREAWLTMVANGTIGLGLCDKDLLYVMAVCPTCAYDDLPSNERAGIAQMVRWLVKVPKRKQLFAPKYRHAAVISDLRRAGVRR